MHAMFVHAHPDDESSKGAATMAKLAAEGHRVSVVTLTDGGAGDILNPAMDLPGIRERILEVRREEIAKALAVLGVTEHYALDHPDSGWVEDFDGDGSKVPPEAFWNVPLERVVADLVPLLRSTKPDVLVTYDETGGYPHPDHIRTHQVSIAAWHAAADPLLLPDAGPVHKVPKVYYQAGFHHAKIQALHDACLAAGLRSPFAEWLERWKDRAPVRITTRVHCADHYATRDEALLAHASQIDPAGFWFGIPLELQREVWPWEEFRLAYSEVTSPRPESSLFDGLVTSD